MPFIETQIGVPRTRAALLLLFLGATIALSGCSSRKSTTKTVVETQQEDELAAIQDALRREANLEQCRTAIAQLNVYIARSTESKPAALTAAEREQLGKLLHLNDAELSEIARDDFTPLDSHHLESCFLLHDAIRSLKLNFADQSDSARLERARLAFAWVVRQIWSIDQPAARPLPALYVLRRGVGTPTERAGAAIEVLSQAGLDAGLVGQALDEKSMRPWAIGVAIGADVYLFDPRAGQPVPGPDGKGIATLKQAKGNPDLVKVPVKAADAGGDVKVVVASSRVWLSPPLSALAPRMRWLQAALTFAPPLVLAADLTASAERFSRAGETVGHWNPPADIATPLRRLAAFVPPEQGGFETARPGQRAFDQLAETLVPSGLFPEALSQRLVAGVVLNRMLSLFRNRFIELAMEPGKPRDLILRGQFDEASRDLVSAKQRTGDLQQRIGGEANLEKDAIQWAEDMRSAYGALLRMEDKPKPGDDIVQAKARVDQLNKSSEKVFLLIEQAAAEPFKAAITYQLALCKHEQAERQSRDRSSPESRREAWENAAGWWNNYLASFSSVPWLPPAQIEHARQLLAQAQREAAK